jgi:hypothetical protein
MLNAGTTRDVLPGGGEAAGLAVAKDEFLLLLRPGSRAGQHVIKDVFRDHVRHGETRDQAALALIWLRTVTIP